MPFFMSLFYFWIPICKNLKLKSINLECPSVCHSCTLDLGIILPNGTTDGRLGLQMVGTKLNPHIM